MTLGTRKRQQSLLVTFNSSHNHTIQDKTVTNTTKNDSLGKSSAFHFLISKRNDTCTNKTIRAPTKAMVDNGCVAMFGLSVSDSVSFRSSRFIHLSLLNFFCLILSTSSLLFCFVFIMFVFIGWYFYASASFRLSSFISSSSFHVLFLSFSFVML
jgi:hypothetical protein